MTTTSSNSSSTNKPTSPYPSYVVCYVLLPALVIRHFRLPAWPAWPAAVIVIVAVASLLHCVVDYHPTCTRDGRKWPAFQRSTLLHTFIHALFPARSVTTEVPLTHTQNYIFASFPHGAYTVNHLLTMTDACGMLSTVHRGDRRDLCASVLFFFPLFREVLLWLGCVDASSATAHHNLRRGRSLLIFVGGEKEQLMTSPGRHQVYVSGRKGFIKLAIEYGVPVVPMYAFGENEAYTTSSAGMGFRQWLQRTLQLGVPLAWGRWGTCVPLPVPLHVEVGAPVLPVGPPKRRQDITPEEVEALHATFVAKLRALFDRTKATHGCPDAVLEVY
jgi:1-acyl-sn-glycerol-3-phosphate acyltransferase